MDVMDLMDLMDVMDVKAAVSSREQHARSEQKPRREAQPINTSACEASRHARFR